MSSRKNSSRGVRSRSARFPKLKPGPGLPAREVAAHQRGRLGEALIELVAENGYDAAAVAALASRARVSKRDFYKRFASKEECFLATYDDIVGHWVREILTAAKGEEGWRERLRRGLLAFAEQVEDNPDAARLVLVEAFAVGAVAAERVRRTSRLFEMLVAKSFDPSADALRPPWMVVKGIVAGGHWMARERLLATRQATLDGDALLEWAFCLCDEDVVRLRGVGAAGTPSQPATATEMPLEDERTLILAATAKLASEQGYATLTVPRVRAVAGVSRRSFDTHFEGVADCFLATLETLSGRALARAVPSYLAAGDWGSGVHRMIASLCQHLASDPTFAGLAFLEARSSGLEAMRWRGELVARLAERLRLDAPAAQQPTRFAAEASVGAIWEVIDHFVAVGRTTQLAIAAPALSYIALAPTLGGAVAVDLIVAEAGRR